MLKTKGGVKVKTEVNVVLSVITGLISTFVIGLAFIGVLSNELNLEPMLVDHNTIEEPQNILIPEKKIVHIDHRYLTGYVVESENPDIDVVKFKQDIEAVGGRVYIIISGTESDGGLADEHLVIARTDKSLQNTLKQKQIVTATLNGAEAEAINIVDYPATLSKAINLFKEKASEQFNWKDADNDNGDHVVTPSEGLASSLTLIDNDTTLTQEQKDTAQQNVTTFYNNLTGGINESGYPTKEICNSFNPFLCEGGMKGLVIAELLFVESTPDVCTETWQPPNDENWTSEEWQLVMSNYYDGLLALSESAPDYTNLGFWIMPYPPDNPLNATCLEPSRGMEDKLWMYQLMHDNRKVCSSSVFGVCTDTLGDAVSQTSAYARARAEAYGADQAFVTYAVRDAIRPATRDDANAHYTHVHQGTAAMVINLSQINTGIVAHETAHIFWAEDEYKEEGCSANAVATYRAFQAGETNWPNKNEAGCQQYFPRALMSTSQGDLLPSFSSVSGCPDCRDAIMSWHSMAQIGWGDVDLLKVKVWNPQKIIDRAMPIWIDDKYIGDYYWTEQYYPDHPEWFTYDVFYIAVSEGDHVLKAPSDVSFVGSSEMPFTIPETVGPGPNNGIYEIEITLGTVCSDGTWPHSCNEQFQYCDGQELVQNCSTCGCADSSLICNPDNNFCVECRSDFNCEDNNVCTIDVCTNLGTANAQCDNSPVDKLCLGRECGTDASGCYSCGACGTGDSCVQGACKADCGDGTISGQCNSTLQYCNDGTLENPIDCRTCGCADKSLNCTQTSDINNTWACRADCIKNPEHPACPRVGIR